MENKTEITERRQHPRYDMYLPVHFHIKDSENDDSPESMKYFQGFTKNYSKGGLLIEALNLSQPQIRCVENLEAFIEGSILIPNHPRPLRFQARPAWSKREENNIELIGLYFTNISKEEASTLQDYAIRVNKKTQFGPIAGTIFITAVIVFILLSIFITYGSTLIMNKNSQTIKRQSDTIQRLQHNQKILGKRIEEIFKKE